MAVARELKRLKPSCQIIYIGQRGDDFNTTIAKNSDIDISYAIRAGKFRRYHIHKLRQLYDIPTITKNTRDTYRVIIGIFESWRLLRKLRPDIIFIKGAYVGVPVGLTAAWLHIPYVTHDSDAIPGLANQIIARWASAHAVALPKEIYKKYPTAKTHTVGVPVRSDYKYVTTATQKQFRDKIGLSKYEQLIFITGGGLGADSMNNAVAQASLELLRHYSQLAIVHAAGRKLEHALSQRYNSILSIDKRQRVIVRDYLDDMHLYSGAADLVITRAGATSMAEFAVQGKACIVIPNPHLTAGHQIRNAHLLAEQGAVKVVSEDDLKQPGTLESTIATLLDSAVARQKLGDNLHKLAHPESAAELAQIILSVKKA
ncbi:MAG: glycosyltransferase [Candidatus Saccharimonadales bacterium]